MTFLRKVGSLKSDFHSDLELHWWLPTLSLTTHLHSTATELIWVHLTHGEFRTGVCSGHRHTTFLHLFYRYCSVNQALFEAVTPSFQKSSRWLDLTSNPMHLQGKSMAAANPRYSLLTWETWDGCVLLRRARTVGTQTWRM